MIVLISELTRTSQPRINLSFLLEVSLPSLPLIALTSMASLINSLLKNFGLGRLLPSKT
jgi:hypothetical protein